MENAHIWLMTGIAVGLIALSLDTDSQKSGVSRIMFGAAGGFLGGWLLTAFQILNLGGIEGHVVRATAGAGVALFLAKLFSK